MRRMAIALLILGLSAAAPPARAEEPERPPIRLAIDPSAVKVGLEGEAEVKVLVSLAHDVVVQGKRDSWHAYHPDAAKEGFIPITLKAPAAAPYEIVGTRYPKASKVVEVAGADGPVPFYEGEVAIPATIRPKKGAPATARTAIDVEYQICFGKDLCLSPEERSLPLTLEVEGGAAVVPGGTDGGGGPEPGERGGAAPPTGAPNDAARSGPGPWTRGWVGGQEKSSAGGARRGGIGGVALEALFTFMAGLGIAFTPCVFPLVPVTVSYFSRQTGKSRARTFALTGAYAIGIATTYSILGVVSALVGAQLGDVLTNPFVVWGFVALFVALSASMFGAFDLTLPSSLTTRIQGTERKGFLGALFLGLTLGLVAAPCVGPVASGLILYVANTKDVLFGLIVFFTFGLGLATPFMALGTFSGALAALPRAGAWMEGVKKFFGFLLLAMALYFLANVVASEKLLFTLLGVLLLVAGAYTIGRPFARGVSAGALVRVVAGLAVTAGGLYFALGTHVLDAGSALPPPMELTKSGLAWRKDHDAALDEALAKRKPVMVDFYATYCAPCRELELTTFKDEAVQKELARFVTVKQDLADPTAKRIKKERYDTVPAFGGGALPLVVFYDSTGKLHVDKSVRQFVGAEEFLAILKKIP